MCYKVRVKILFVSSEIVPFASSGGLGDVCAALPKALSRKGINIIKINLLCTHSI